MGAVSCLVGSNVRMAPSWQTNGTSGQWLSFDPAGTHDGSNLFASAGGNPINVTTRQVCRTAMKPSLPTQSADIVGVFYEKRQERRFSPEEEMMPPDDAGKREDLLET